MSNIKVSSDIDEILRKSTKAEVNAFLGVNTIKSNTDTNTADIATNASAIALNTAKVGITTSQAEAIAVNTNKVGITTEQATAISDNTADIASNVTNIATNATNIASNVTNIATNATNIATNATDIGTANTNIATNATSIATNATDIATANTNIATNATDIATNATDIATNATDIATNTTDIATANTNITTANTNIATNATNIATKAPLDSPNFTGDLTINTNALKVDSANNFIGINKTTPSVDLDVSGDVNVSGDLYASNYLGGTGAFADTSISGDLQVNGDASITGDLSFSGDGALSGDVTVSGELSVDQSIDCPEILATTGTIGEVQINSTDLLFENNNSNSVKLSRGGMTLSQSTTSLIKEDCYFKSGAVRLQRASSADDEILMRYLGQNSNDFVIQQFSGGDEKGHIKFLGNTSQGSRVRLEADQIDVGFNRSGFETNLVKIYSDTNIGANKKLVFKDSRTSNDGLIFEHSGNNTPTIQMGMYGSSGDTDFGKFKLTHTDSSATSDVICIDKDNNYVRMESPRTEMNNAQIDGTLSASNGNFQTDTFGNLYNVSNIISDGEIESVSLSTSSSIECGGQATFEDNVEIQGSLDCGSLSVSGNVSWNGDVTIDGYTKTGSFDGSANYPSSPSAGMIIFDNSTGVNKFYGYDGTQWNELG